MDSAFGVRTFCPKLERLYPMISSRSVYSFTSCILSNIYCEVTFIQCKVKHLVLFPLLYLELFQHHLLKRLSFPTKISRHLCRKSTEYKRRTLLLVSQFRSIGVNAYPYANATMPYDY